MSDNEEIKYKVWLNYIDILELQECIGDSHIILSNQESDCKEILTSYDIENYRKWHKALDDLSDRLEIALEERRKRIFHL